MDYVDRDTKRITDQEGEPRDGVTLRSSPAAGEIIKQPVEQTVITE